MKLKTYIIGFILFALAFPSLLEAQGTYLGPLATDPVSPTEGTFWDNTGQHKLKGFFNGATVQIYVQGLQLIANGDMACGPIIAGCTPSSGTGVSSSVVGSTLSIAATGMLNPLTTAGDRLFADTAGVPTRFSGTDQIISGADYTNSTTTPSTVVSWVLPPTLAPRNYRYSCDIMWESTAATVTGPQFGVNMSAAPTQLTANSNVQTALAGNSINGYLSNTATGHQNLGVGTAGGVTTTNYTAKIWGTIEGAPAAGSTFIIDAAALSNVTSTLNIRRGGGCTLSLPY